MRPWNAPTIAVLALLLATREAHAADPRVTLRGGAGWVGTKGEWTGDLLLTEAISITKLKADSTSGPQLSLEYRFTDLLGGELSLLQGSHEISETEFEVSAPLKLKFGDVKEWPVLFGVNFHVSRNRKVDLYFGPVIGWVIWGDLKPSAAAQQDVAIGNIKMHDDFAWGVNVGLDLPFARHWVFNLGLKGLDYSGRTDSGPIKAVLGEDLKIPISPLIATAGLGVRW